MARESEGFGKEKKDLVQEISLYEGLVRATFNHNRALPGQIDTVYMGNLQKYASSVLEASLQDYPFHREARTMMYVLPKGTLFCEQSPVLGDTDTVTYVTRIQQYSQDSSTPMLMRQDRHLGTVMHSHGLKNTPPSPIDFKRLLTGVPDVHGMAAIVVVTPDRTYAVFRGPTSPNLPIEEAEAKVEMWTRMVHERTSKHLSSFMTPAEVEHINRVAQNAFIRDFSKLYGFLVFSGPTNRDPNANVILKRHTQ